jgi:hypothetical protein
MWKVVLHGKTNECEGEMKDIGGQGSDDIPPHVSSYQHGDNNTQPTIRGYITLCPSYVVWFVAHLTTLH